MCTKNLLYYYRGPCWNGYGQCIQGTQSNQMYTRQATAIKRLTPERLKCLLSLVCY